MSVVSTLADQPAYLGNIAVLIAGAIGLLGCVFFRTNSGLHLHGKVLVDGRHLHMQEEQACLDPAEIMVGCT